MPRIMFTISYGIKPEKREEYIGLTKEMKDHFTKVEQKDYSVFEVKGKKNQFTEVFITNSVEEFDALEDNQDEKTEALVNRLEEFVDEEGMKYSTLIEAV
jgi:hypothetical protein